MIRAPDVEGRRRALRSSPGVVWRRGNTEVIVAILLVPKPIFVEEGKHKLCLDEYPALTYRMCRTTAAAISVLSGSERTCIMMKDNL